MTVEELNKLIKEELSAFFENEDELETIDAGDDIEITTDEPEMGTGDEAIDLLRQIYDLIKPEIEGEAGEEVELDDEEAEIEDEEIEDEEIGDGEDDEAVGYPNYKADQVQKVKHDASDVNKGLNESRQIKSRFQKLANIKK